jgi:hypothetical protein
VTATDADGAYSSSPLVAQVLGSGVIVSPVTPAISAIAISSSEIGITYIAPAGSDLMVEWFQPGDLNYHSLTTYTVLSSDPGQTTVAVHGLSPSSQYYFRLKLNFTVPSPPLYG